MYGLQLEYSEVFGFKKVIEIKNILVNASNSSRNHYFP